MTVSDIIHTIKRNIEVKRNKEHWQVVLKKNGKEITPDGFRDMVYKLYTNPSVWEGLVPGYEELANADVSFTNENKGWKIISWNKEGSIKAEKNKNIVIFAREEHLLEETPTAGKIIAIPKRKPWNDGSSPFLFFFSDTPYDNEISSQVRVYFNVSPDQLPTFISKLTATLNKYQLPFHLKTLFKFDRNLRADNTVLYFSKEVAATIFIALSSIKEELEKCTREGLPLFTKPLMKGASLAESPVEQLSFGVMIAELFYASFISIIDDTIVPEVWEKAILKLMKTKGYINSGKAQLFLNPHTQYPYPFQLIGA